jgi:hypothetical protein
VGRLDMSFNFLEPKIDVKFRIADL